MQIGSRTSESFFIFGGENITEKRKHFLAGQTDLATWLRSHGETLKKSGTELEWNSSGERVTIRENVWFNHYSDEGGDAVRFLQTFYGYNEDSAVDELLGHSMETASYTPRSRPSPSKQKEIELVPPAVSPTMRRVFAYLCQTRKISQEVVSHFAHAHTLYESAEYHNCLFIGRDENGKTAHVCARGTYTNGGFRQTQPGSRKAYSFNHVGTSGQLYVFEAPIDMLSYISMNPGNWQEHSYVALCGVSLAPIERFLDSYPQLEEVTLCLDNDEAGHKAALRMARQLYAEWDGLTVTRETPELKDWNEDLQALRQEELAPAMTMQRM